MTVMPPPSGQQSVLIVGGGPAGLTAAAVLSRQGQHVVVLDREEDAGGIPRHSDHTGYGFRDLRRVMTGPAYARRLVDRAVDAGARIETGATVTGWAGERAVEVTSASGRLPVGADAVILATGARERPRSARLVPGDRPRGVLTTGQLQNLVHLQGQKVGSRAVVVGAELVSWSAVLTLRHAGCDVVSMVSAHQRPEVYRPVALAGRLGLGVPVIISARVVRVIGKSRVEAVEVEHLLTGRRTQIACDVVVFTGDWFPDHELARTAGLEMDPCSRGPLVDTALRTSNPGVFAIGNVVHPVDTADVAALDGAHVVTAVTAWLAHRTWPTEAIDLHAGGCLAWVAPGRLDPRTAPARNRLLAWSDTLVRRPLVTVRQADRELTARRLCWPLAPGRMFRIPASVLRGMDPAGGAVTLSVEG